MHVYEHWHTHMSTQSHIHGAGRTAARHPGPPRIFYYSLPHELCGTLHFLTVCTSVCAYLHVRGSFFMSQQGWTGGQRKRCTQYSLIHTPGAHTDTHMNLWNWPELAHAHKSQICHCLMPWEKVAHSATINCWCCLRLNTTRGSVTSPWGT